MSFGGRLLRGAFLAGVVACGNTEASRTLTHDGDSRPGADHEVVEAGPAGDGEEAAPAVDRGNPSEVIEDAARPLDGNAEDGPGTSLDSGAHLLCNGHEALCDRRFNEVVFPAAHNAMSSSDEGWIAADQVHGMQRQLQDGIRAMLIDTYDWLGEAYLCHTSCLLGAKRLVDGLGEMAMFLRQNPNEVLTLIFEDYISTAETEAAFVDSGLVDFVYAHPPGSEWPTLRTMIEDGHRVFVGAQTAGPPPAWYHHFYDLAWDTPYSFKTTSDFSCAENRGKRGNDLFLLNHWLENPLPSEALSATANAHDVLLGRAKMCQSESGKLPNFVAVNHYSVGDLFAVVRELNAL